VSGVGLDVTDGKAVSTVIRGVAKERGRLDIVVANAGVMESALLGMIRQDSIDMALSTNVSGTIHTVQAAGRAMMRNGGAIVLLGSLVGERGSAGQLVYAASKAAVANMARSAAKELGRYGVRVNAVAPGVIETQLTAQLSDETRSQRVAETPLGRLGTPEEVASVITFLACDGAAFITGQVIGVDGGLVL
jgi:3-oxoacyl-[acyl-carrier protein] reductase